MLTNVVVVLLWKISVSVVSILLEPGKLSSSESASLNRSRNNGFLEHDIILNEFKAVVSDAIERDFERSDQYLLRWLKGNEMDVESANQAFRKAQKWREENGIDNILNETQHVSVKDVCHVDGYSVDGEPVFNFRMSETDFRKVILAGQIHALNRVMTMCYEKVLQDSIKSGKEQNLEIVSGMVISNLHGFNMRQHFCTHCPSVYRFFIELEKYYYPNIFNKIIAVNAPAIFRPLVELMRPLFSQSIQNSLVVLGNNRTEWFKYLSKFVPVHQLPPEFGGTKLHGES